MNGPRPLPEIVKPGQVSPEDELQALTKASFQRRLTDAERQRQEALSFAPDREMERVRLIRDRHPDLYGQVRGDLREQLEGINTPNHKLESYEARRRAAIAAGRAVLEPDAQTIAEVDVLAAEYRATDVDPHADMDARHRAAFASAVKAGDFGLVVTEWAAWLAEHAQRNAFVRRRTAALQGFGRSIYEGVRNAPSFIPELEAALGGGTIAETMPILGRG